MPPLRGRNRSGRPDHGLRGLWQGPSPLVLEGTRSLRLVLLCARAATVTSEGNIGAGPDDHPVRPGTRGSASDVCAAGADMPAPPISVVASPSSTAPAGVNKLAIASLICGLAGIPLFGLITGLVAVFLGVFALASIRASAQRGLALALAGVLLGIVDVTGWIIVLGMLLHRTSSRSALRRAAAGHVGDQGSRTGPATCDAGQRLDRAECRAGGAWGQGDRLGRDPHRSTTARP